MKLSRKSLSLWELAEVYLWSACATASRASEDSSASQAHVSREITERTPTLEFVPRSAQRSATRPPLFDDISLAPEGLVS